MNNILSKEEVCFNSLEKGVFDFVCGIGRYITESILIGQDKELHQKLKKKYRNKGYAITVIKTIYGEVTYKRHKYLKINEDGSKSIIMPLDEMLKVEKIGLVSKNLAERIVEIATKNSFREIAEIIRKTTNVVISHQACWKVVQEVGESIKNEEKNLVNKMYGGELKPQKEQHTNDKIYQLDPFHVNQAIKRNIAIDKEVAKEVTKLYDGGNHMAKILYTKENGNLSEAINETPITVDIKDIIQNSLDTFSAGKIPVTIGSGSKYIDFIKRFHFATKLLTHSIYYKKYLLRKKSMKDLNILLNKVINSKHYRVNSWNYCHEVFKKARKNKK